MHWQGGARSDSHSEVPLLPGAVDLSRAHPRKWPHKRRVLGPRVSFAARLDPALVQLMSDPQTSGGLLAAVSAAHAPAAEEAFRQAGVSCRIVGRAIPTAVSLLVFD